MTAAVQIALTATPIAAYLYALGLIHGGSTPRVALSGPADVALMAFGLGGLVAFGPFGTIGGLARLVGAEVGPLGWSIWVAVVVLWSLVLAGVRRAPGDGLPPLRRGSRPRGPRRPGAGSPGRSSATASTASRTPSGAPGVTVKGASRGSAPGRSRPTGKTPRP